MAAAAESEAEQLQLMDLPETVLLHILSYMDHDFLRHIAPHVNVTFKKLAHSRVLWKKASLSYNYADDWEGAEGKKFIRDLQQTLYLGCLEIGLCNNAESTDEILAALIATHCKINQLSLSVDQYGPELLLLLQQHPEIRELKLTDEAIIDDFSRGVAATVGSASRLISLDLSNSNLMRFPESGLLLASSGLKSPAQSDELKHWLPAQHSCHWPSGSESNFLDEHLDDDVLDLEDSDDDEKGATRQARRVLQSLTYTPGLTLLSPPEDHDAGAAMASNLVALLGAHRHSLRHVNVDVVHPDVFSTLADCPRLETLSIRLGPSAAPLNAMLKATQAPLRSLQLSLSGSLPATELASVLESLSRYGPSLEHLELTSAWWDSGLADGVFPGFAPMRGLLQDRGLAELRLSDVGFVGRAELEQLAALAPRALRLLEVRDCNCSSSRAWAECRERADGALLAAMPGLTLDVASATMGQNDYCDFGSVAARACDCDRFAPGSRRPRRGSGRARQERYR